MENYMRIVIVTGMSGAGKTTALKNLEDAGYYCIDNMPIQLSVKFFELATENSDIEKLALGIDIRSGHNIEKLEEVIDALKKANNRVEVLFLESNDEVLVKRYKETRRSHPLAVGKRVDEGIIEERQKLANIKKKADYIIDTSMLITRELKQELDNIFVNDREYKNMYITVMSFGFKYGIPNDADLVFDVRFLPNPYYVDDLRDKTGNDEPVHNFVMNNELSHTFLEKLSDMVKFLIPNYVEEGKTQLVVAVGCTGGKHRSVTIANELAKELSSLSYGIKVFHRDIEKDSLRKK